MILSKSPRKNQYFYLAKMKGFSDAATGKLIKSNLNVSFQQQEKVQDIYKSFSNKFQFLAVTCNLPWDKNSKFGAGRLFRYLSVIFEGSSV